jgi:hypothetical protein
LLSRTYDIISNGMVLIRITETFPSTSFAQTAVDVARPPRAESAVEPD